MLINYMLIAPFKHLLDHIILKVYFFPPRTIYILRPILLFAWLLLSFVQCKASPPLPCEAMLCKYMDKRIFNFFLSCCFPLVVLH